MHGYFTTKMKRKDLEDANDEFSDFFSLASPARKIRRLDVDLPPIMEEDGPEIPLVFGQSLPQTENFVGQVGGEGLVVIEELPSETENEERAIVLFKPMNTPVLRSPSAFSISINSDLVSGIKNPILWSSQTNLLKVSDGETEHDKNLGPTNGCLAVVPWVSSHAQLSPPLGAADSQAVVLEMMEEEEPESATMDIEENDDHRPENEFGGMCVTEQGLNQWQQHCVIPHPPQNLSTPITWFR